MKIAVAQIEVVPGQPEKNLKTCLDTQQRAFSEGADITVFPELCLSGYLIGDLWEEESFITELMEMGSELSSSSTEGVTCFGNVGVDDNALGEDGRIRKFNSAWVADHGVVLPHPTFNLPFFPKTLLPNYREFEETRYFLDSRRLAQEKGLDREAGVEPVTVQLSEGPVSLGVYLCEDGWHEDYRFDVPRILERKGARCLINLSGSPFTLGKEQKRHRVFSQQAKSLKLPLVYVNCTGMQNNGKTLFSFDGNSTVYNAQGAVTHAAPHFSPSFDIVNLDDMAPLTVSAPNEIERIHQCLKNSAAVYMRRFGLKRVVVGISGGIDSAVSAAFFTDLLGPENVLLVNMPSRYNTDTTKNLASNLMQRLDTFCTTLSIEQSVALTTRQIDTLEVHRTEETRTLTLSPFHLENVQARDRSSRILSALAAAFDGVYPSNANKAETMVGYATLYGDHSGFLAPLADLWKHQVYALGTYLNEKVFKSEIIPQGIFDLIPSAELSDSQNPEKGGGDPLIYWYHDRLFEAWMQRWRRTSPEEILEWYTAGELEKALDLEHPIATAFPSAKEFIEDLEKWWRLFKGLGVVKRVQAPPVLAVCRRAFGYDYRESLLAPYFTRRYRTLRTALLKDDSGHD